MTNVLFLSRLYIPHVGGVERHVEFVARELIKQNFQINLLTEQFDESLSLQENMTSVDVVRIPKASLRSKFQLWYQLFKNFKLFKSAQIIHVHDVFWWILPFMPLLWFFNIKVYITFHGYEGDVPPKWEQKFWHQLAARLTHGNICIGGFHQKWYGVQPDFVSFGGVEVGSKSKLVKKSNPKLKIIYMGRLATDMGLMNYLQACRLLKEQKINFSLDIFGDGPLLKTALQFVNQYDLPVKFHGYVQNATDKVIDYDMAFVASYLSILEVMSIGVPIIATFDNQLKFDYLTKTPFADWLTITDSPEQIAHAVIKGPALKKAAREWAQSETWTKVSQTYRQLWQV